MKRTTPRGGDGAIALFAHDGVDQTNDPRRGDQRFAPGENARDLKHFVDLLGYSASEALQCGTRVRGEVMGLGDELGMVKEGYIANLPLADGGPLRDLELLVRECNLHVIMKDGVRYKNDTR